MMNRDESAEPGMTVVMPTRGNVAVVLKALAALRAARDCLSPEIPVEFFMVDDSAQEDAARLRAACDPARDEYYISGPRIVAQKRNIGARLGKYTYILFLDSDCIPVRSMLDDHYRMLRCTRTAEGMPVGAITGAIVAEEEARDWFWKVTEFSTIFNAPNLWPLEYREVFWAPADNLSMRREVFEEIGGFHDEPFTVVGGEDVDICMKLRDAGYTITCIQKALVYHSREPVAGFSDIARKMFTYGRSSVYNASRQPHCQGWHANRITLSAGAVAAALLTGRRQPVRAAVAAVSGIWLWDAARLMRQQRSLAPSLAVPAVAVEWIFDGGIVAEALRRKRPDCLVKRFRYFDQSLFRR